MRTEREYDLAVAVGREILVRAGKVGPIDAKEERWLQEGPRDVHDLETRMDWE